MEPFEIEIRDALNRTTPLPAAELARLSSRVTREYAQKQRTVGHLTYAYLAVLVVVMALFFWQFMESTDPKLTLAYGLGMIIMFEGTVLMKLWFWVLHGKIATLREIKLLQLLVAERLPRPAAEPAVADAPPVATEAATSVSPEPGETSRRWKLGMLLLWLVALTGLLYSAWPRQDAELRDAVLYHEKTVNPGEVRREERVETFEVREPRQRFHVRLVPPTGHAQVRIAVGPDGGEPFYQGPLDDSSRIYFGRDLAPGKYFLKVRAEKADAGYALRVYGLEKLPDTPRFRTYLAMVCCALGVVIPLLWLQRRWLQRIDPELAR